MPWAPMFRPVKAPAGPTWPAGVGKAVRNPVLGPTLPVSSTLAVSLPLPRISSAPCRLSTMPAYGCGCLLPRLIVLAPAPVKTRHIRAGRGGLDVEGVIVVLAGEQHVRGDDRRVNVDRGTDARVGVPVVAAGRDTLAGENQRGSGDRDVVADQQRHAPPAWAARLRLKVVVVTPTA